MAATRDLSPPTVAGPPASASPTALAARRLGVRAVLLGLGLLCLAAYVVAGAYLNVTGGARLLPSQFDNTYPESSHLYGALAGARSGHIYLPLYASPYVVEPYGPLFSMVNVAIARAAHLSLDLARLEIRAFTFACFLLCGLVAVAIAAKMKQPPLAALLAGVALLAQPYFIAWNVTVRPDMLCLLLMLLCLFFAVAEEPTGAAWCLCGFFGGAAFLVKQPGIAAPIAVAAIALLHKQFRRVALLIGSAALPAVAVFAVLLLRREPFLDQFASVGNNLWSLANGARFVATTADVRVLVGLVIGALAVPRAIQAGRRGQIIVAFTLVSVALGLSGMPQVGADVNYYLPPLAGCALLLPFFMAQLKTLFETPFESSLEGSLNRPLVLAAVLAVAVFVLYSSYCAAVSANAAATGWQPPRQSQPYANLARFRIFSDRPVFSVHGRDPELLFDPFTIHGLEVAGHWDSAPISSALRRSDYDLVILACSGLSHVVCNWRGLSYFSPVIVAAINDNYAVFCTTLSARVLVPRARSVDITPQMLAPALGQPCGLGQQDKPPGLYLPPGVR